MKWAVLLLVSCKLTVHILKTVMIVHPESRVTSFPLLQGLFFFRKPRSHPHRAVLFQQETAFSDFFKYSKTAPKGCGLF